MLLLRKSTDYSYPFTAGENHVKAAFLQVAVGVWLKTFDRNLWTGDYLPASTAFNAAA